MENKFYGVTFKNGSTWGDVKICNSKEEAIKLLDIMKIKQKNDYQKLLNEKENILKDNGYSEKDKEEMLDVFKRIENKILKSVPIILIISNIMEEK